MRLILPLLFALFSINSFSQKDSIQMYLGKLSKFKNYKAISYQQSYYIENEETDINKIVHSNIEIYRNSLSKIALDFKFKSQDMEIWYYDNRGYKLNKKTKEWEYLDFENINKQIQKRSGLHSFFTLDFSNADSLFASLNIDYSLFRDRSNKLCLLLDHSKVNPQIDKLHQSIFIDSSANKIEMRLESEYFGIQQEESYTAERIQEVNEIFDTSLILNYSKIEAEEPIIEDEIKILLGTNIDLSSLDFLSENDRKYIENKELILLDFWYKSCLPCLKSNKYISEFQEKYSQYDFHVIGINPRKQEKKNIEEFVRKNNIHHDIAFDLEQKIVSQLGIQSYPTFVFIDSDSNVVFVQEGFSEIVMKRMDDFIFDYFNK